MRDLVRGGEVPEATLKLAAVLGDPAAALAVDDATPPPGTSVRPSPADLVRLAKLTTLTELDVACFTITDAGERDYGAMTIDDAALAPLAKLPLVHLGLYCSGMSLVGLSELLAGLPALRRLELVDTGLLNGALMAANRAQELTHLMVSEYRIADRGLEDLSNLSNLYRLEYLDLSTCQISGRIFDHVGSFKSLIELNVADTALQLPHLQRVLLRAPSLRRLDVSGTDLTRAECLGLVREHPELVVTLDDETLSAESL